MTKPIKHNYWNPMNLVIEFIHEHILAIDFALFILIWLVQLVIYPVFHFVSERDFSTWHEIYCKRIAYFVLPLMFAQLFESSAACFFVGTWLEWIKLFLILSVWVVTFLISAPCHHKLSKIGKDKIVISKLVLTNWIRTILWTMITLVSYFQY